MKFSVITPVRNMRDYITGTIESVINQININSKFSIQYIIVDGNSTDGTLEIIQEYEKNYSFITVISEEDESMYDALQKGLKIADGDIISYVNAGDIYNLNAISIIENIVSNNKKIKWITGGKYIYNENSEIIRSTIPYSYRPNLIRAGVYGKYLPYIQQESTFWTKELNDTIDLEKLKKFKLAGDYYLWFTFSEKYKLNIIQTHLGGFKIHKGQLSTSILKDGSTYYAEVKTFIQKLKFKDLYHILCDVIPWAVLKYGNVIFGYLGKHYVFETINNNYEIQKLIDKDNKIYCWVCDTGSNRGEGKLALQFFRNEFNDNTNFSINNSKFNTLTNYNKLDDAFKTESKINLSFYESYILPIMGILWLWKKFLSGKKICYVNFLPLWNILLFIFLPPKTKLGPITGSVYEGNIYNLNTFIRKKIIPILYIINSKLILLRQNNLIFSTTLLSGYFSNNKTANIKYDYILNDLRFDDYNKDKDIDLLIYFRKHETKNSIFFKKIIEYFDSHSEINFGYFGNIHEGYATRYLGLIENDKVNELLRKTKFSIISDENFYSFYCMECLTNHVNIYHNENNIPKKNVIKNNNKILKLNFSNTDSSIDTIKENILNFDKFNSSYN